MRREIFNTIGLISNILISAMQTARSLSIPPRAQEEPFLADMWLWATATADSILFPEYQQTFNSIIVISCELPPMLSCPQERGRRKYESCEWLVWFGWQTDPSLVWCAFSERVENKSLNSVINDSLLLPFPFQRIIFRIFHAVIESFSAFALKISSF